MTTIGHNNGPPVLECDDGSDDLPLNKPRAWKKSDLLTPAPPKGWLILVGLSRKPTGLDIGVWICAIRTLQVAEIDCGRRRHHIAREPDGTRILLVASELKSAMIELIDDFNSRLTECNCGGTDCLAGDAQFTGLKSLATKAWNKLSISKRIKAIQDSECDEEIGVSLALQGPAFFTEMDGCNMGFFEALIQAS